MSAGTAIQRVGTGWSIAPANMGELYKFAEMLAASDLVPKDYRDRPGNCMVAIQMGGELGLSPMQSIQNIAVINGRPSLWGDAMLAVCLPHLDEFEETFDEATMTATCRAVRGKRTVVNTFSMLDAKTARLWDKKDTPWQTYPKRMLKMRARGFALRDICADVLRGINSAEESQDIPKEVRAEVLNNKPAAEPKAEPKQERKSTPPPAAPNFARAFPNKNHASKPLADAPMEILEDYRVWLQSVLDDDRKRSVHETVRKSLAAAVAEVERRIAATETQTPPAEPDSIAEALQAKIDERSAPDQDPNNGDETNEMAEGWR